MERATQYARTSDGVRIAFCTKGQGKPFVEMPPIPVSHGAGPADIAQWQAWDEQIAARGMLVEYDCRGAGMSARDVSDYSLDGWIADIEAVADALGGEPFVLFAANSLAVPVAIAYAARYPGRLSHLVLWQAHANVRYLTSEPGFAAVLDLIEKDWVMFTEVLMQVWEGYAEPETAHREAAKLREVHTAEGLRAALNASIQIDVTDLLPAVTCPTLVLHRRDGRQPLEEAMKVASGISGAVFLLVEGNSNSWAMQHPDDVLRAIDDFVGWRAEPCRTRATQKLSRREFEVMRLLAQGKSAREIGAELVLAVRTVERHISNVYRKLGARNRAHAVALAIELGIAGDSA